jgi:hypothetical protein
MHYYLLQNSVAAGLFIIPKNRRVRLPNVGRGEEERRVKSEEQGVKGVEVEIQF